MSLATTRIRPSTFSIVARDPANGDLGVAVQSKFLAVGSLVPWAQAGMGAVATQSYVNVTYGPEGLRLMAAGWTAQETLNQLLRMDEDMSQRQVLLVDAAGCAAAHTGESCHDWAGQGAPACLVDTRHAAVAGLPQLPLMFQSRAGGHFAFHHGLHRGTKNTGLGQCFFSNIRCDGATCARSAFP